MARHGGARVPSPRVWRTAGLALALLLGAVICGCGSTTTATVTVSASSPASSSTSTPPTTPPTVAPSTSTAAPSSSTSSSTASSTTPSSGGSCAGTGISHPLDPLDASQGARLAEASGCGAGYVPAGGAFVMVPKDNWVLNSAYTCPDGSAGPTGMGPVITYDFLRVDGTAVPGDPSQQSGGDWAHGGSLVVKGGNLRIHVTTVSPLCQWHVAIEAGTA